MKKLIQFAVFALFLFPVAQYVGYRIGFTSGLQHAAKVLKEREGVVRAKELRLRRGALHISEIEFYPYAVSSRIHDSLKTK